MAVSEEIFSRLFELIPFERSMPSLVSPAKASLDEISTIQELSRGVAPAVQAGLWLYVGELERAHYLAQNLETEEGSYWHAIVHRIEGDFWNSKYWFRRCRTIRLSIPDYEPSGFVDEVEADRGANKAQLIAMQRQEWLQLLQHCFGVGNV